MTDKEQMLLEALKLARKHLPLSFVDLPDGHFRDVRGLIDEAIEAAEPTTFYVEESKATYQLSGDSNKGEFETASIKDKAAEIRAHRKEEAENNNI